MKVDSESLADTHRSEKLVNGKLSEKEIRLQYTQRETDETDEDKVKRHEK